MGRQPSIDPGKIMEWLIQAVINKVLERNSTTAARARQPPALGMALPPARCPRHLG